MKEPKKLECKKCKSNKDLHEHTHPAGWTYVLCGDCTRKENDE